jgi:putative FmdB family regulatory protein
MPIYAYKCSACGHAQDVLRKISDPPLTQCPACGAETFVKQVTAAGFQLKGSGWYVTDFRGGNSGGKKDAAEGDAAAPAAAEAEAGKAAEPGASTAPATPASAAPAPGAAPGTASAPSPAASPAPAPAKASASSSGASGAGH